jgi:hypothetical protein
MALTEIPIELSSTPGIVDNSNATAITIDASENVGIGVVPTSAYKMQVNVATNTVSTGTPVDSSLFNIAGGTTTVGDGVSLQLSNISGAKETGWRISAVTASGNNGDLVFNGYAGGADYPERMRIDASGNVGIGNSSPTDKLHLGTSSGGAQLKIQSGSGINNCVLHTNGTTDSWRTGMNLSLTDGSYEFYDDVNNVSRMVLDSSGNLLVGRTNTSFGNTGHVLAPSGFVYHERSGGDSLMYLNRLSSDGDIVRFYRDTTTQVGSIGSRGGVVSHIVLDPRSGGAGLTAAGASLFPTDNAGAVSDGAIDLGYSVGGTNYRFKDLHLSGGVVFGDAGGAVSSKTLDDYEEGTWTPTLYYQNATGVTRTYTEQTGHYTKIGNTVTLWCTLKGATSNSGSYINDNMGISGLPFSVIGNNATVAVRQSGFAGTASVGTLYMLLTGTVALLSTPENINNLGDDLGAGATYTLTFSGSYETTA